MPTIRSQARCTTLTSWIVGRSLAGVSSSPWMTVEVPWLGSDRIEARPGIGNPPTTSPSELRCPKSTSGTSLLVLGTISIAANFVGWLL